MAWTTPMTFVADSVLTAAQMNTFVRDNLNECPTAKATLSGRYFVATGLNQVAQRRMAHDYVAAQETTTSTSWTNLTTQGPAETMECGFIAIVMVGAHMWNSGANETRMSAEVAGPTNLDPHEIRSLTTHGTGGQRSTHVFGVAGLTPGEYTFTAKYQVGAGTGTFRQRRITVLPF